VLAIAGRMRKKYGQGIYRAAGDGHETIDYDADVTPTGTSKFRNLSVQLLSQPC
jgi:hypothetical protein